jgi:hypothetical protein
MPDFRTPFETAPTPVIQPEGQPLTPAKIVGEIKAARLRTVKRAFVFLLMIVLAAFVGTSWKAAFAAGVISWRAVTAPILFAAFFPYAVLALRWHTVLLMNILAALTMVLAAAGNLAFSPTVLAVAAIFLAALFSTAWISIAGRLQLYLAFKMSAFAGGFGMLIIAFSMFIAGLSYQGTIQPAFSRGEFFVSLRAFERMLSVAQPFVAKALPGFRADMTIGDFVSSVTKNPVEAALFSAQLADRIGRRIAPSERVASVLRDYFGAQLNSLPLEFRHITPIAAAVLVFFFTWSVGVAARPAITIVSWIILQFLIGVRFFGVVRASAEQKRLELL